MTRIVLRYFFNSLLFCFIIQSVYFSPPQGYKDKEPRVSIQSDNKIETYEHFILECPVYKEYIQKLTGLVVDGVNMKSADLRMLSCEKNTKFDGSTCSQN